MTEEVDTDTFDFYLKFAKPLVLNLPDPNERVLAAAWVKKLRDENAGSENIRRDYLKLLLFALNRKKLAAPFSENPLNEQLKDLQRTNEILEFAKEIILKEERDRKNRIKTGLAGGDYPPYSTECSADLLEYAAAQDIPKFGVHAYYALSLEPITKWDNADKGVLPKGVVPESLQKSMSSTPAIATAGETPKKTPKATPKKTTPMKPKTPVTFGPEPETSTPKRQVISDSPFGLTPPVDERSPVTWGSNLLEVLDTSESKEFDSKEWQSSEYSSFSLSLNEALLATPKFDKSTLPSLPYLTPTRQGDFSHVEAPSLPYLTPMGDVEEPTTDEDAAFEEAEALFNAPSFGAGIDAETGDFLVENMDVSLADSSLGSPQVGPTIEEVRLFSPPRQSPPRTRTTSRQPSPVSAAEAQYASLMSPPQARSPQTMAEAQYASLGSPQKPKSPRAVAEAQYASLRSPQKPKSPRAVAEAQYASLRSPQKPKTPQSVADAQLASLYTPEASRSRLHSPPRPQDPTALAEQQYATLFSPDETSHISTSRSQEANSIIDEVNASLQHISVPPEPSPPPEFYDDYYGHKRKDMPPTPPVFSRHKRIREGPGRDTVYEPEQFGISAGEAWQPAVDFTFQDQPPGTTPVKPDRRPYQKKPKPVEVVFPKLKRDDWSEVFFDAQIPDLIDEDESDFMESEISEVPEEDMDNRIKKLLSELRDDTEDTPAAGGVAATTPKSTPAPIRIHPYGTDFPLFEIGMPEFFSPVSSPSTKAAEQYAELMGSPKPATPARTPSPPPKAKTPSPVKDPNVDDLGLPHLIFEKPPPPPSPPRVEKSPPKKAETPKKQESPKRTPPKNMNELQAVVDAQYASLYETLIAEEPKSPSKPKSPIAGPSTTSPKSPRSPQTPPPPSPGHFPPTVALDWETPPRLKIQKPKTPPPTTPPSPFTVPQGSVLDSMLVLEGPPEDFDLDRTPPTPPQAMTYEEYVEEIEPFLRPDEDFNIEEDISALGPLLESHEYQPYDPRTSIRLQVGRKAKRIPISSRRARKTSMSNISEEPEFTYLPTIDVFSPPAPRQHVSPPRPRPPSPQPDTSIRAASPIASTSHAQTETEPVIITRDIIKDAKQHFVAGFENENMQSMLHRVLDLVEDVEGEENIINPEELQRETAHFPTASPTQFLTAASPPRVISEFEEIEKTFGATPPRPSPPRPATPPPPLDIPEFGFQGPVSDFMPGYEPYLLPFQREGYVRPEVNIGKSPKKLTPPRKNVFGELVDYQIPKRPTFPFLGSPGRSPESPVYLVGDDDDTNLAQALVMEEPIVSSRPRPRTPGRSPQRESPPSLPVRPTRLSPESPPSPDLIDFIVSTAFRDEEPYYSGDRLIRQGESSFIPLARHAGRSAVPVLRDVREVPEFYDDDDLMFLEEVDLAHELYPWARQRRPMNVRTGRRTMRLDRRGRRPDLPTVTEELDHVPTPTRMPPRARRRSRIRPKAKGRRLDFGMENPDAAMEPRKIPLSPDHRFEPGQPLPTTPPRGAFGQYLQRPRPRLPEDLFGMEADVPHYNRETLLDVDNIPIDLPGPMQHQFEIAGWKTPPHLKTPPPPPPERPRFTDDFVNFMSYETAPEEYLLLPDVSEERQEMEDDTVLTTALPFFMERERSPASPMQFSQESPPRVFGRAEPRTRVPRAPSPAMKKTVTTFVQDPSGTETTSTFVTETSPRFPTPPPPVAPRSKTPSPRTMQLQENVYQTAEDQYKDLFYPTPSPRSSPQRARTPSPGVARAAGMVEHAAAEQYAALFDETPPGPSRRRTPSPVSQATAAVMSTADAQYASLMDSPQPGPSWRRTPSAPARRATAAVMTAADAQYASLADTPKRSVEKTTTVSTKTPKSKVKRRIIEKVVSPTTPRNYDVTKPSPYFTGRTPEATPPMGPDWRRSPSPQPLPPPPTIFDNLPAAGSGLGDELEPLDLMPMGSPASPHSTRSHMQQFMSEVRQSGSKMARKPIVLHGYGERKPYKLPRRYMGGAGLETPWEELEPETEDDYVYWPGPHDPRSVDLSQFAPKHLKYTEIENVETYEPAQFSPLRMPDRNLPLVERAEHMVGDVPIPEDLQTPAFSPHVPHVFQTPPRPSPKFPRSRGPTEHLDEMEFPEDDILMSPITPPGIPDELRRRSPGTPLGTPPWRIPDELRRRTPGTPLSTPPFRGDRFEGAGLEEGSPLAFYSSPAPGEVSIIEETEEIIQPRTSPSPQGYSPGTAAEIASVRLQAHALGGEFRPDKHSRYKLIKKRKRDLRLVPEIEEPPESPYRPRMPSPRAPTPQHRVATDVYAAAEAQYAGLLSPEVFRDPRFEIASPPMVVEELPKYERFDPVAALERPRDAYDDQFSGLAAQASEDMFLTGSPIRPVFEDDLQDQFDMIAAEGEDDFLASPELYMSPEMSPVDPFTQSVREHEYTESFSDPHRQAQRSKMLVVGRKGMKLRRHAPKPKVHDIIEVAEEPIYSGRMGAPALYPGGTPMSAIAHYTPPSLGEQVRFEESVPYRHEYTQLESQMYGDETPGMMEYYERRHEPRPPLTRTRLFEDYEDSPVRAPSPPPPAARMSPQPGPSWARSPQPRPPSPQMRMSPQAQALASEGSPPDPFSISGFSEKFGYSPRDTPEVVEEFIDEEVMYGDVPVEHKTSHYKHVSPQMSPGGGGYNEEIEELYESFEDYGDLGMFGGDLEPAILDTSDIPPETEDDGGDEFGWLD